MLPKTGLKVLENHLKPFIASHSHSLTKDTKGLHPLIVMLHGGPHTVTSTSEALFPLLLFHTFYWVNDKVLKKDVKDVLSGSAIDHVVEKGLADPSKIAVLGGSQGGFLTTHLIAQVEETTKDEVEKTFNVMNAPERFAAAAVQNPVCNLALIVGTTDIPDWCYVESYGSEATSLFTEATLVDHLHLFHSKSPISHISKLVLLAGHSLTLNASSISAFGSKNIARDGASATISMGIGVAIDLCK
ncbi:hypothetical protein ACLOJK_032803 [Asimina triloba]